MGLLSWINAFHVIAVVAWFAGLFYLPRLLVYFVEAESKPEVEKIAIQTQLMTMAKRLSLGIMLPAMVIAVSLGITLLLMTGAIQEPWMHTKLLFVIFLLGFHHWLGRLRKQLEKGVRKISAAKLRIANEIPTVLLVGIVVTVYLRDPKSGLVAATVLLVLLGLFFGLRKGRRDRV